MRANRRSRSHRNFVDKHSPAGIGRAVDRFDRYKSLLFVIVCAYVKRFCYPFFPFAFPWAIQ